MNPYQKHNQKPFYRHSFMTRFPKCLLCISLLFTIILSTSCEKKVVLEDVNQEIETIKGGIRLTININKECPNYDTPRKTYETRAVEDIRTLCQRINLIIFKDGKKLKSINKTINDKDYMQFGLSLPEGQYQLLVLAHDGKGNPTITSPTQIKFTDNKVTETFYCYQNITVSPTSKSHIINLKRAVAKFTLNITDPIPEDVQKIIFYYTGGSSTFNAVTGYGSVKSRQTEERAITPEMKGKPASLNIFTFPHSDKKKLNIKVSGCTGEGTCLHVKNFDEVPIQINQMTIYEGKFFENTNSMGKETDLKLMADTTWIKQIFYF